MRTITLCLATTILTACAASRPPQELVDARAAYHDAASGVAGQETPVDLHVAKEAIAKAEDKFVKDGDEQATRDLAYIAARKAQLAEAAGRTIIALKQRQASEMEAQRIERESLKNAQTDLASTRQSLDNHTDSQGQHQHNMELAQRRADAVKAQLVTRGVAADRIQTTGIGPDRPVADNKSAEGRANNRRVEIIVEPPKQ